MTEDVMPVRALKSEAFVRYLDAHIGAILEDDDMPCLEDWRRAMDEAILKYRAAEMLGDA